MKYDAGHKERTRSRVLAEAARALRVTGPDRLVIADVMSAAGLTVGGFYSHFGSKEDLMAHAVGQAIADFNEIVDAAEPDAAPAERLGQLVRFYLSRAHRDAPETGCPLPGLSGQMARMGDAARRRFDDGFALLSGRIERLLAATGGREDPADLAGSVTAEMIGALTLARASADPARSDAILRRSRDAILSRCALPPADRSR